MWPSSEELGWGNEIWNNHQTECHGHFTRWAFAFYSIRPARLIVQCHNNKQFVLKISAGKFPLFVATIDRTKEWMKLNVDLKLLFIYCFCFRFWNHYQGLVSSLVKCISPLSITYFAATTFCILLISVHNKKKCDAFNEKISVVPRKL